MRARATASHLRWCNTRSATEKTSRKISVSRAISHGWTSFTRTGVCLWTWTTKFSILATAQVAQKAKLMEQRSRRRPQPAFSRGCTTAGSTSTAASRTGSSHLELDNGVMGCKKGFWFVRYLLEKISNGGLRKNNKTSKIDGKLSGSCPFYAS